ncbi:EF-Tu/IF-2/RF-3 family GTPase [Ruania halotolerans]|uniref:EF-Tu/IF-2/RF-3 family GTPase n=1 Tax=Ruania halotolerans TaxID=2897773 RepID=UPI001E2B73B3|nr:EF-Tu/IF-2/RF-3 family GTPase [Ruania halotolerans]UFU06664.1 hypothetical protein LQF10_00700 [Ruania halotolerans]
MFWRTRKATGPVPETSPADFTSGGLTVEDVFSITGRGTVVTGRVDHGRLVTGQPVTVTRDGQMVVAVRIAGLEQFHATSQVAEAGDHVGLLLDGVDRTMVQRGDIVTG